MKIIQLFLLIGLFVNTKISAQKLKLEDAFGEWQIDTEQSVLTFAIENFVMGTVKGVFKGMNGVISINTDLNQSAVIISIDASTLDAGNEKRDEHLIGADFFDIDKYPLINYEGSSIEFSGNKKNPYTLKGVLNIKDHKKTVHVPFNHSVSKDGSILVVVGKTEVSKNDFDLDNWKGVGVGEKATVTFKVIAQKK